MVLEGDGLGFLFLFSDLLGVRLRLRLFRVSRAGPDLQIYKTKPECGPRPPHKFLTELP